MAYRLIRAPKAVVYEASPYSPESSGHYGWGLPFVYEGVIGIFPDNTRVRVISGVLLAGTPNLHLYINPTLQLWQWIAGSTGGQPASPSVVWVGESGWNAGGKSHRHFDGSGDFSFKLSDAVGAVAGLARAESSYGFAAIEHGWYLHDGGTLEIVESGTVVFTLGSAPPGIFSQLSLGVRRRGAVVSYTLEGGVVYTSSKPSLGPVVGMGIPYSRSDFVEVVTFTEYSQLALSATPHLRLMGSDAAELFLEAIPQLSLSLSAPALLKMQAQPALRLLTGNGGEFMLEASAQMALSAEPALQISRLELYGHPRLSLSMIEVGQSFDFKPKAQPALRLFGSTGALLDAQVELSPWMRLSGYDTTHGLRISPVVLNDSSHLELTPELHTTSTLTVGSISLLIEVPPQVVNSSLSVSTFAQLSTFEPLATVGSLTLGNFATLTSALALVGTDPLDLADSAELETVPPLLTVSSLSLGTFARVEPEFRLERLEQVALHLSTGLETLSYLLAPDGLTFADFTEIISHAPLQGNEEVSVGFSAQLESGSLLLALSGLAVSGFSELRLQIDLRALDGLKVADTTALYTVLELASFERLIIHAGQSAEQQEAAQYAINLTTGAVSTHQGAHFSGYTHAAQTFFGWRADGLYQLGTPHSDDINARVDLGRHDLGSPQLKHVVTAWLGLRTDAAQVRLILASDDGTTRTYVVRGVDTVYRALLSKGAVGRLWNVALELDGTRYAQLDGVDLDVLVAQRRRR